MKRLAIYLMAIFGLTVVLNSCQSDFNYSDDEALIAEIQTATNKTTISTEDLSTKVNSELSDCYFETYVYDVQKAPNKGYEIKLGNGEFVYYNMENRMLQSRKRYTECGEIERPKEMICDGEKHKFQNKHHHHHGNGENPPHGDTISIEDLPSAIINYIETNYPDDEIFKAKMVFDAYLVKLSSPIVLKFDLDGNFIEEMPFAHHHCHGLPINIDELLPAINEYISANYPNAEIKEAFQHPEKIEIRLLDGEQSIIVVFDLEGNFLFEKICG